MPFLSNKGQILFIANRMPVIFISILLLLTALLFAKIESIKMDWIETQLTVNEISASYDFSKLSPFNFTLRVLFDGKIKCNETCEYRNASFYGYAGNYDSCIEFHKRGARNC